LSQPGDRGDPAAATCPRCSSVVIGSVSGARICASDYPSTQVANSSRNCATLALGRRDPSKSPCSIGRGPGSVSRAGCARFSAHLRETPTEDPCEVLPRSSESFRKPSVASRSAPSMGGMPRGSVEIDLDGGAGTRRRAGRRRSEARGRWHAPRRLLRFASAADRDKYPADSRRTLSMCTPESGHGLPHRQIFVPPASRIFRILEVHPPRPLGPGSCMGAFAPGPRAAFDARRPGA
jgi:hypothetical protein